MKLKLLRIALGSIGLVPIYLGLTGMIMGLSAILSNMTDVTSVADGQYRYLSAIYLGFGCLILWIQARLKAQTELFRILMATVFVAGVSRSAAILVYGLPSEGVILATVFEWIAPPLLVLWQTQAVAEADETHED